MAPTRKSHSRTVPAKTGAKHKSTKQHPAKATWPPAEPTPTTTLPTAPPVLLIVGIGASAGGLEAMEELRAMEEMRVREGKVERSPDPG